MRFLKHFNLDVSYYNTKTYNQTFDPQISVSSGYSTLYVQTGSVRNRGIELALGYGNKWGEFSWSSNFTLSSNQNRILELVDNYRHPETGQFVTKDRLDVGGLNQAHFILKKGGSLGDLYSIIDLKRDANGHIYVDENDRIYTVSENLDDIRLGSVFPKANMAWRNDFRWKNLSFGFMVSARIGGIVYSATQAQARLLRRIGGFCRGTRRRRRRRQRRFAPAGLQLVRGRRRQEHPAILHLFGDERPLCRRLRSAIRFRRRNSAAFAR